VRLLRARKPGDQGRETEWFAEKLRGFSLRIFVRSNCREFMVLGGAAACPQRMLIGRLAMVVVTPINLQKLEFNVTTAETWAALQSLLA
jgi:hypothetical protein